MNRRLTFPWVFCSFLVDLNRRLSSNQSSRISWNPLKHYSCNMNIFYLNNGWVRCWICIFYLKNWCNFFYLWVLQYSNLGHCGQNGHEKLWPDDPTLDKHPATGRIFGVEISPPLCGSFGQALWNAQNIQVRKLPYRVSSCPSSEKGSSELPCQCLDIPSLWLVYGPPIQVCKKSVPFLRTDKMNI